MNALVRTRALVEGFPALISKFVFSRSPERDGTGKGAERRTGGVLQPATICQAVRSPQGRLLQLQGGAMSDDGAGVGSVSGRVGRAGVRFSKSWKVASQATNIAK